MPGGLQQLLALHVHAGLDGGEHVQGGGDLQLPGRRQMGGRGRPQRGQALLGPQGVFAQPGGALVEEHRAAAPGRCARAAGRDRSPEAPGTPGCAPAESSIRAAGQQRPQVPGVGLIGLGVPLAAAGGSGAGRLTEVRGDPGCSQLLADIPPPSASLHRERGIVPAREPGQPGPQVLPVGRGDLAALDLPGHGVEIVEGDLLPVDIQPAYDRHRDLLTLPRAPRRPTHEWFTNQS